MTSPGQELEYGGDGDVQTGDLPSAKLRYGSAIDSYLDERDYDSAIRTCRKLIALEPDVVRTHYTLAYLLVGQRRFEEALDALDAYSAAVLDSHKESYAAPRLTLLAYVTDDAEVRSRIRAVLDRLGTKSPVRDWDAYEAEILRAYQEETSPGQRWAELLPVALQNR